MKKANSRHTSLHSAHTTSAPAHKTDSAAGDNVHMPYLLNFAAKTSFAFESKPRNSQTLSPDSQRRSGLIPMACTVLAASLIMGCASKPAEQPQTPASGAQTSKPAETQAAASTQSPAAPSSSTSTVTTAPSSAADDSATPAAPAFASFAAWKQDFARQAQAAGISQNTIQTALANARFLPRVVELDRAQPEFTRTAWQYLDGAVSAQRVTMGRKKMQDNAAPLRAASQRFGVPASVIASIWGMESNYGSNFGSIAAVDALATLAYDGRRAAWASKELLAALRIIDSGDIDARHMVGSWAGALGHTQFLPSVYLQYAVDADGDGRRDIWGSLPDVTASTANYLAHAGWNLDEPWGVEVKLPIDFDYARADMNVRQNSAQWTAQNVQSISGKALPSMAGASIISPAGARGPAFMVGSNFRTILRYNNSINYALAVSLLSDQLTGKSGIQASWPRDLPALSREQMRSLQNALNARGFEAGTADGVMGPATRAGLRQYQQSQKMVADGFPTLDLLQQLQATQP